MDKGSIISGSFFVFRYIKNDIPSFAFVAPKKLAKTAIKRNYLRRRGYNIIHLYNLKPASGIFFYKKEGITAPLSEIRKDIEYILKKTHII